MTETYLIALRCSCDAKSPEYGAIRHMSRFTMASFVIMRKTINPQHEAEPNNTRPGAVQTYNKQGTCTASSGAPARSPACFLGGAPNTPERRVMP